MNRLIFLIIYILIGVLICGMMDSDDTGLKGGLWFYTLMTFVWPVPVIAVIAMYAIAYTYRFGKKLGKKIHKFAEKKGLV